MINEGAQLKIFMDRVKLTQAELGEALGKDQQRVSKWINGTLKVPQSVLVYLHEKHQLNYNWFFHGTMPMVLKDQLNHKSLVTDISKLKNTLELVTQELAQLKKDFKTLHADYHGLKRELKVN